MRGTWLLGVSMVGLVLGACSFSKSDHPAACSKASECESNNCVEGFCVPVQDGGNKGDKSNGGGNKDDGGGAQTDGGSGGGHDAGKQEGEACADGSDPIACYDGPEGTADIGICRSGQRGCVGGKYSQCLGQALPGDETCNGKDDDCNGETDEIQMGGCSTQMSGVCAEGALKCRGVIAVCEPVNQPANEECNTKDDDCDGKTDEMTAAQACYPKNQAGCTANADGTFTCVGLCKAGKLGCAKGGDSCDEPVTPAEETCTEDGVLAADEDCDAKIDEGCPCANGSRMPCYSPGGGTELIGECHAGTQACANKQWGPCVGEQIPTDETCDNPGADNNCDMTDDNIPGLGTNCFVPDTAGVCLDGTEQCAQGMTLPICVSKTPKSEELCDDADQDCDGDPTNGFDLESDPDHCGSCDISCGREETCCKKDCIRLDALLEDRDNCGACGHKCENNEYCCQGKCTGAVAPSSGGGGHSGGVIIDDDKYCQCADCADEENCCGKSCVNLAKDANNCGYCGHQCGVVLGLLGVCKNGVCN